MMEVAAPTMRRAVSSVLFCALDQLTRASRNTLADEVR
jgi:hypothetical protein